MDVSAAGIGVMSLRPLPWGAVPFAAEVSGRRIEFQAHSVWVQEGTLEEKRVWRGGFRIGSINAEGWRSILDYCNASLPADQQVVEPPMLRVPPHEVERVLPEALRTRIAEALLAANRVTFLGAHPNLQYSYGGVVHRDEGLLHKMCVVSHSVESGNRVQTYETAVYFGDGLDDISIEPLLESRRAGSSQQTANVELSAQQTQKPVAEQDA